LQNSKTDEFIFTRVKSSIKLNKVRYGLYYAKQRVIKRSTNNRQMNGYVYTVPLGRHLSSIFDPNTIDHNDVNSCAFVWVG